MSFDARSRERLEALGRRLPTRLPLPGAGAELPGPPAAAASPGEGRHRLELEQDPDQLFRELMAASPDGSVPPHHLERLRQLEQRRQRPATPSSSAEPVGGAAVAPPAQQRQPGQRQPTQRPAVRGQLQRPGRPLDPEQQQAYTAFQQLLLEGDA